MADNRLLSLLSWLCSDPCDADRLCLRSEELLSLESSIMSGADAEVTSSVSKASPLNFYKNHAKTNIET